jgi:hypothetical protein
MPGVQLNDMLSGPLAAFRKLSPPVKQGSYHPEELFDAHGVLVPEITALAPHGLRRMSANPHANGGVLLRELRLPDFRDYVTSAARRRSISSAARLRPSSRGNGRRIGRQEHGFANQVSGTIRDGGRWHGGAAMRITLAVGTCQV